MAYTKTEWKGRQGTNLNRFTKSQETEETVILTNTPDSIIEPGTPFSAENMNHIEEGIADAHDAIEQETQDRTAAITGTNNQLSSEAQSRAAADNAINAKIPNQASAENQLADKNFVNSSITAMAARPLTYDAAGSPFPTKADLDNAADFYYQGQPVTPTDNDYVVVQADETQNSGQVRYGYAGGVWVFRYKINDAPFTAAQNAALNSGATAENIADIAGKAPINSPAFTGTPAAPTPGVTDNSIKLATTSFVRNATFAVSDQAENGALFTANSDTTTGFVQKIRNNLKWLFNHNASKPTLPNYGNRIDISPFPSNANWQAPANGFIALSIACNGGGELWIELWIAGYQVLKSRGWEDGALTGIFPVNSGNVVTWFCNGNSWHTSTPTFYYLS